MQIFEIKNTCDEFTQKEDQSHRLEEENDVFVKSKSKSLSKMLDNL